VPLDREVRIMHFARALKRKTSGKHFGELTGKFVRVAASLAGNSGLFQSGPGLPAQRRRERP
jgi:hypothetical protein